MFILMECCDRCMELLGAHENKDEAFVNLEAHLAEAIGLDEIPEDWDHSQFRRDEDFGIDEDSAWLNRSSCEYDWKIFEVNRICNQTDNVQRHTQYSNVHNLEKNDIYEQLTRKALEEYKRNHTKEPVVITEELIKHIACQIHKTIDDTELIQNYCFDASKYGGFHDFYMEAREFFHY